MTNIFKMQLLLALLALAGLTTACGDDGDGDGMMAGDDDDDMMVGDDDDDDMLPVMCGESTCMDFTAAGFLTIPGCCADESASQCGGGVSENESGDNVPLCEVITALNCDAGCIALNQAGDPTPGPDGEPGNEDDECPPLTFVVPGQPDPTTAPGCCRPDGQCGYFGDFTDVDGPNFGCVPFDTFDDGVENTCIPAS
jgi:hypothetical protein